MKIRKFSILFPLLPILCPPAPAQVPARWDAEASRDLPYTRTVYRGETLALAPDWLGYGAALDTNGWSFTAWWSTNGVLWWSKSLSADPPPDIVGDPFVWSPDQDCGAKAYTLFIRATSQAGHVNYRANARLTMLASPGFTPNSLPLPAQSIDFGSVDTFNAPWTLRADWQAGSNALAAAISDLTAPDLAPYLRRDAPQSTAPGWSLSGTTAGETGSTPWSLGPGPTASLEYKAPELLLGSTRFRADGIYTQGRGYEIVGAADLPARIARIQDIRDATNALVQTYILGADAWMTVSNAVLTVWRSGPDGATNALWSSSASSGQPGIDPGATNALWSALASLAQQVQGKAPLAWGRHAPDGSANPEPDLTTLINSPSVLLAGGYRWDASGTFAALATSAAAASISSGPAGLRIGISADAYFGLSQGGSIVVGAVAESFYYSQSDQEAYITYAWPGGAFPVLWFSEDLAAGMDGFAPLANVQWQDNGDGTAICAVPATTPRGFFYATSELLSEAYFVSAAPALFAGGVFGSTNSAPVVYDSTITVTSGGHAYRIPAQLAD
jgi:hypothetical protein